MKAEDINAKKSMCVNKQQPMTNLYQRCQEETVHLQKLISANVILDNESGQDGPAFCLDPRPQVTTLEPAKQL